MDFSLTIRGAFYASMQVGYNHGWDLKRVPAGGIFGEKKKAYWFFSNYTKFMAMQKMVLGNMLVNSKYT